MRRDRRTGRARRGAGGFTLIEVLVVIAIISLLVGLLMPALNHVRKSMAVKRTRVTLVEAGKSMGLMLETFNASDLPLLLDYDVCYPDPAAGAAVEWGTNTTPAGDDRLRLQKFEVTEKVNGKDHVYHYLMQAPTEIRHFDIFKEMDPKHPKWDEYANQDLDGDGMPDMYLNKRVQADGAGGFKVITKTFHRYARGQIVDVNVGGSTLPMAVDAWNNPIRFGIRWDPDPAGLNPSADTDFDDDGVDDNAYTMVFISDGPDGLSSFTDPTDPNAQKYDQDNVVLEVGKRAIQSGTHPQHYQ